MFQAYLQHITNISLNCSDKSRTSESSQIASPPTPQIHKYKYKYKYTNTNSHHHKYKIPSAKYLSLTFVKPANIFASVEFKGIP